jgi:hypothetical protein
MNGVAALQELETIWNLDDVERGNAMVSLKEFIDSQPLKDLPTAKGKR